MILPQSNPFDGSSNNIILGSPIIACAKFNLCFIPFERSLTFLLECSSRKTVFKILSKGQLIKELDINEFNNSDLIYKELSILLDEKINDYNLNYLYDSFKEININNINKTLNGKFESKDIIKLISYLITSNIKIIDIKITDKILEEILTNLS